MPVFHRQFEMERDAREIARMLVERLLAEQGPPAILRCFLNPKTFFDPTALKKQPLLRNNPFTPDLRGEAASVLGEVGDETMVPELISVLQSHLTDFPRCLVAEVLGKMKATSAVDTLIACIKEYNYEPRKSSVWALGNIGDPRAVEPLLDYVIHPVRQDSVWSVAVEALEKFGNIRALQPFIELVEFSRKKEGGIRGRDVLRDVREAATCALERVRKDKWL